MRSGKGGSGGGDELDDEDVEGMDQFEGEERDDGLGKLVRPTKRRRGEVDRFVPDMPSAQSAAPSAAARPGTQPSQLGAESSRRTKRAGMGTGAAGPSSRPKVEPVNLQQHLEILDAASASESSDEVFASHSSPHTHIVTSADGKDSLSFDEEEAEVLEEEREAEEAAAEDLSESKIQSLPADVQKVLRQIRDEEDQPAPENVSGRNSRPPGPGVENEEEEEEYEVEKIVDSRIDGHGAKAVELFLVKWKGWPSSSNTWEPEENLGSAKQALARFRKKVLETQPEPRS